MVNGSPSFLNLSNQIRTAANIMALWAQPLAKMQLFIFTILKGYLMQCAIAQRDTIKNRTLPIAAAAKLPPLIAKYQVA